ncbi:MAG TPA: transporter substrate-binding domain-containing protein [Alphaproteobacteria bacterium]|nr:transporter substrate-binding domain-containing protein [Alphaproteobacteria bacterium]
MTSDPSRARRPALPVRLAILALAVAAGFARPAAAEEIPFGLRRVAPYVYDLPDGRPAGLEYDILAAALAVRGHTMRPLYYPFGRLGRSFVAGQVEAAAPISPSFDVGGHLSEPYLTYHNVAVSLASRGLRIDSVADLARLRVVAFQNASVVLGPDFAKAVAAAPGYEERADQLIQVRLLYAGRVDVIVGERAILAALAASPELIADGRQPVSLHAIFPPTPYRAVFREARLRDDFDAGLKAIRADGTYDALVARHLGGLWPGQGPP